MRITLIMILMLFFTACSSTKVHVYTVGIDQHIQQQLIQSLNSDGINASLQTTPLPPWKEGSYIVYTPDSRSAQINRQIEQILKSLALPTPESHLFSFGEGISAHRYTKGNIGLYVIGDKTQQENNVKTLAGESSISDWELSSFECDEAYVMDIIVDSKTYISKQEDGVEISALNWKIDNKKLVLTKLFKRFVYDISETDKTITPTQQYPEPYGCQFRSTFGTTSHIKQ